MHRNALQFYTLANRSCWKLTGAQSYPEETLLARGDSIDRSLEHGSPFPHSFPVFIKIPRDSPCVPSLFLTVCAGHRHKRRATRDRYEPLSSDRPRHHHRDATIRGFTAGSMTSFATKFARINSALPLGSFACMLIDRRRCSCAYCTLC